MPRLFEVVGSSFDRRWVTVLGLRPPGLGRSSGLFKLSDEPRVTRVGRFLRRTSIDELPQLLNVLRGATGRSGPIKILVRTLAHVLALRGL